MIWGQDMGKEGVKILALIVGRNKLVFKLFKGDTFDLFLEIFGMTLDIGIETFMVRYTV